MTSLFIVNFNIKYSISKSTKFEFRTPTEVNKKLKDLQETLNEYAYKNRLLSRELDYSNRQVEELKRLLVSNDSWSNK